jgi:hypothetical protein
MMDGYEAVRRLADLGMRRAHEGAIAFHPFMREVAERVARSLAYFTMDDIWDEQVRYLADPPPFNMMAYGSVLRAMQKDGLIVNTGKTRPSRRRKQHRHRTLYLSRIHYPGARVTAGGIQPPLIVVEPMSDR